MEHTNILGDTITNDTFIRGIFGHIIGNERPIIVSLAGNPDNLNISEWIEQTGMASNSLVQSNQNSYVSLATFRPDNNGKYHQQKKQFAALFAVILNDVGGQVPLERIGLAPSWVIETAKNNFQIGFILASPIMDSALAERLLEAIVDAGLTTLENENPYLQLG